MFIFVCYFMCAFGLVEILYALSSNSKDADWEFLKGITLVFVGVMLVVLLTCVGVA